MRIALRVFPVVAVLVAVSWGLFADRHAYLFDGQPKFEVGAAWMFVESVIIGVLAGGLASLMVYGTIAVLRKLKKREGAKLN